MILQKVSRESKLIPLSEKRNCADCLFSVLPQILPFNFGEDQLNLYDTVSATCTITKGDTPIDIGWSFMEHSSKFSKKLFTNDGVVITRAGNKVSILTIESVNARHRGSYTCTAKNLGGVSNFTTTLTVNGTPLSFKFFLLLFSHIPTFLSHPINYDRAILPRF